jgi:hypothetical protein
MAEPVTKPTKVSVKSFIAAVPNETRRKDGAALLKLFEKATGWKAQMWGPTIVGFGRYAYTYESGRSGDCCVCGFSPRAGNLVLYVGPAAKAKREKLLKKLGKHKTNGGCIYVNKLTDIDEAVLADLIKEGVAEIKKTWPVSAI